MPYMRDMWTDFEDRWSPKRELPQAEFAVPGPVHFEKKEVNGTARPSAGVGAEARSAK
jgi:hypothetical protein